MDGLAAFQELDHKTKMLDLAVKELRTRGIALAEAERDYRVELAKAILDERDKGTPVTIIGDVCRGKQSIANLRFERECAEVLYRSALEAINSTKLQLRLIENQIQREYGQSGAM